MYNKDYQDYLNVLRTREPRPPFSEMARLVVNAPARSPAVIPLYAKFAGALAIGGIIVAGSLVLLAKFHPVDAPTKNNLANANSPTLSHKSYPSHGSFVSLAPQFTHARTNKSNITNSTGAKAPVLHIVSDDSMALPIPQCAISEQAFLFPYTAADARLISPIAIPPHDQETMGSFFSMLGGAISRQFNAPFQQTSFSDAFLGVGYSFSSNSSVRMLAGEEVFSAPSSTTTNSISFHDTTFVHNGQSYQNVLGEIQSVNPAALTRVYWLGASYRYTLGDVSNTIHPFAELMAGGSTDGFLTHQSLGAEFTATSNIDLDLLFEASELIPQNSSWLTKAGFSAAVSYCW